MSSLPPEQRLIVRAKEAIASGNVEDNPKFVKLFKRIVEDENLWLYANKTLFGNLTWAMEVTTLGLSEVEITAVAHFLSDQKLEKIQLNSPEAYRAIVITALRSKQHEVQNTVTVKQKEIADSTGMACRFSSKGVVVSGYMYGHPTTTYITKEDYYHRTYSDQLGQFQEASRASQLNIPRSADLFRSIVELEKNIGVVKETWISWLLGNNLEERILNLEKYSDAQGAFA